MAYELWLPDSHRNLRQAGFLTYLRWRDVSDTPMSEDRLRELAASLPVEAIMRLVSVAGVILDNTHTDLNDLNAMRGQQAALVRELCEPGVATRAQRYLGNGRRDIFVHREQLLIAAKLAILYGKPELPEEPVDQARIGALLLGINEMIGHAGEQPEAASDLLTTLALRREALGRNEQLRYAASRYYDLLITRARGNGVSFEAAFQTGMGMSIAAYLGFALMYLAPFHGVHSVNELAIKDFLNIISQYESQIRDAGLRKHCEDAFSLDRAGFQAALQREQGSVFSGSYLAFKEHPLYRMQNGSAIPISMDLLEEKIEVGPYWALHTQYLKDEGEDGVQQFVGKFGIIFEEYLSEVLRRTYTDPALSDARFYDEHAIIQANSIYSQKNKPPFDAAIVQGDNLILIEMFAGALPLRVLERADPDQIEQDVARYKKKIKQLARAVKEIARKQAVIEAGFDLSKIHHIYPVVALLHPYPQSQPTWQPLLEQWKLDGSVVQHHKAGTEVMIPFGTSILSARVHTPQIITAEEFEMLEPLLRDGSLALPDVLQQKQNDDWTRSISMKNFLLNNLRMQERTNEAMRALYDVAMSEVRTALVLQREGKAGLW